MDEKYSANEEGCSRIVSESCLQLQYSSSWSHAVTSRVVLRVVVFVGAGLRDDAASQDHTQQLQQNVRFQNIYNLT